MHVHCTFGAVCSLPGKELPRRRFTLQLYLLRLCMRCAFWLVQSSLVQAMTSSTAPQFDAGTYREGLRVSPAFQRNKQPILEAPHKKCCIVMRCTDASQKLQRHAYTLPIRCLEAVYPTASSLRIHCTGAAATPAQATAGRHRVAPSARGRLRPGRAPMSTTSPCGRPARLKRLIGRGRPKRRAACGMAWR